MDDKLVCILCQVATFQSADELLNHLRIHTGDVAEVDLVSTDSEETRSNANSDNEVEPLPGSISKDSERTESTGSNLENYCSIESPNSSGGSAEVEMCPDVRIAPTSDQRAAPVTLQRAKRQLLQQFDDSERYQKMPKIVSVQGAESMSSSGGCDGVTWSAPCGISSTSQLPERGSVPDVQHNRRPSHEPQLPCTLPSETPGSLQPYSNTTIGLGPSGMDIASNPTTPFTDLMSWARHQNFSSDPYLCTFPQSHGILHMQQAQHTSQGFGHTIPLHTRTVCSAREGGVYPSSAAHTMVPSGEIVAPHFSGISSQQFAGNESRSTLFPGPLAPFPRPAFEPYHPTQPVSKVNAILSPPNEGVVHPALPFASFSYVTQVPPYVVTNVPPAYYPVLPPYSMHRNVSQLSVIDMSPSTGIVPTAITHESPPVAVGDVSPAVGDGIGYRFIPPGLHMSSVSPCTQVGSGSSPEVPDVSSPRVTSASSSAIPTQELPSGKVILSGSPLRGQKIVSPPPKHKMLSPKHGSCSSKTVKTLLQIKKSGLQSHKSNGKEPSVYKIAKSPSEPISSSKPSQVIKRAHTLPFSATRYKTSEDQLVEIVEEVATSKDLTETVTMTSTSCGTSESSALLKEVIPIGSLGKRDIWIKLNKNSGSSMLPKKPDLPVNYSSHPLLGKAGAKGTRTITVTVEDSEKVAKLPAKSLSHSSSTGAGAGRSKQGNSCESIRMKGSLHVKEPSCPSSTKAEGGIATSKQQLISGAISGGFTKRVKVPSKDWSCPEHGEIDAVTSTLAEADGVTSRCSGTINCAASEGSCPVYHPTKNAANVQPSDDLNNNTEYERQAGGLVTGGKHRTHEPASSKIQSTSAGKPDDVRKLQGCALSETGSSEHQQPVVISTTKSVPTECASNPADSSTTTASTSRQVEKTVGSTTKDLDLRTATNKSDEGDAGGDGPASEDDDCIIISEILPKSSQFSQSSDDDVLIIPTPTKLTNAATSKFALSVVKTEPVSNNEDVSDNGTKRVSNLKEAGVFEQSPLHVQEFGIRTLARVSERCIDLNLKIEVVNCKRQMRKPGTATSSSKVSPSSVKPIRFHCPNCQDGFQRITDQMKHKCKGRQDEKSVDLSTAFARLKMFKCLDCLEEFSTTEEKMGHACSKRRPAVTDSSDGERSTSTKRKRKRGRPKMENTAGEPKINNDDPMRAREYHFCCQLCGKWFLKEQHLRSHKAFCLRNKDNSSCKDNSNCEDNSDCKDNSNHKGNTKSNDTAIDGTPNYGTDTIISSDSDTGALSNKPQQQELFDKQRNPPADASESVESRCDDPQSQGKSVKCKSCGRMFTHKRNLDLHLMWNTSCKAAYDGQGMGEFSSQSTETSPNYTEIDITNEPKDSNDVEDYCKINIGGENLCSKMMEQTDTDDVSKSEIPGSDACLGKEEDAECDDGGTSGSRCPFCKDDSRIFPSLHSLSMHTMYAHNKTIYERQSGWYFGDTKPTDSNYRRNGTITKATEEKSGKLWTCLLCTYERYVFTSRESYVAHYKAKHDMTAVGDSLISNEVVTASGAPTSDGTATSAPIELYIIDLTEGQSDTDEFGDGEVLEVTSGVHKGNKFKPRTDLKDRQEVDKEAAMNSEDMSSKRTYAKINSDVEPLSTSLEQETGIVMSASLEESVEANNDASSILGSSNRRNDASSLSAYQEHEESNQDVSYDSEANAKRSKKKASSKSQNDASSSAVSTEATPADVIHSSETDVYQCCHCSFKTSLYSAAQRHLIISHNIRRPSISQPGTADTCSTEKLPVETHCQAGSSVASTEQGENSTTRSSACTQKRSGAEFHCSNLIIAGRTIFPTFQKTVAGYMCLVCKAEVPQDGRKYHAKKNRHVEYKCGVCSLTCIGKRNVIKHVKATHGDVVSRIKEVNDVEAGKAMGPMPMKSAEPNVIIINHATSEGTVSNDADVRGTKDKSVLRMQKSSDTLPKTITECESATSNKKCASDQDAPNYEKDMDSVSDVNNAVYGRGRKDSSPLGGQKSGDTLSKTVTECEPATSKKCASDQDASNFKNDIVCVSDINNAADGKRMKDRPPRRMQKSGDALSKIMTECESVTCNKKCASDQDSPNRENNVASVSGISTSKGVGTLGPVVEGKDYIKDDCVNLNGSVTFTAISGGKFECPLCKKVVGSQVRKRHMLSHANKDGYHCSHCKFKAAHQHLMVQHVQLQHRDTEWIRSSYVLDNDIIREGRKLAREKTVVDPVTGVGRCSLCNIDISRHSLPTHMLQHMDKNPFKCKLCEYSCKQVISIQMHVKNKHAPWTTRKTSHSKATGDALARSESKKGSGQKKNDTVKSTVVEEKKRACTGNDVAQKNAVSKGTEKMTERSEVKGGEGLRQKKCVKLGDRHTKNPTDNSGVKEGEEVFDFTNEVEETLEATRLVAEKQGKVMHFSKDGRESRPVCEVTKIQEGPVKTNSDPETTEQVQNSVERDETKTAPRAQDLAKTMSHPAKSSPEGQPRNVDGNRRDNQKAESMKQSSEKIDTDVTKKCVVSVVRQPKENSKSATAEFTAKKLTKSWAWKICSGEPEPYRCNYCNFQASKVSSIRTHVVLKHNKQRNWIKESYTIDKKALKESVELAKKQPFDASSKKYTCSFCRRKCSGWSSMTVHALQHTGANPFQCNLCSYSCKQNVSIKLHVKKTHTSASVKLPTNAIGEKVSKGIRGCSVECAVTARDAKNATSNNESAHESSKLGKHNLPLLSKSTDGIGECGAEKRVSDSGRVITTPMQVPKKRKLEQLKVESSLNMHEIHRSQETAADGKVPKEQNKYTAGKWQPEKEGTVSASKQNSSHPEKKQAQSMSKSPVVTRGMSTFYCNIFSRKSRRSFMSTKNNQVMNTK